MALDRLAIRNIKSEITRLLIDRAPDAVRIIRIHEILSKKGYDPTAIDAGIESMIRDEILEKKNGDPTSQMSEEAKAIIKGREYVRLKNYDKIPIKGERLVGGNSIVRLIPYARAEASELNEIIDTLVDYTNELEEKFTERIQQETSRIYRQMISIFGVFVSIFAIIIISTDKLITFNPSYLENHSLWTLFVKSCAIFAPVLITILILVFTVRFSWNIKRKSKK